MAFEIDPVEDLAAAVDWYVEVIGDRVPRPPRRVADPAARAEELAAVERRIAPYSLPAEIQWFWATWDPEGFDLIPPMPLDGPATALFGWNLMTWEYDGPRALFPIGYASHDYLVVDVTGPEGTPAPVWTSTVGGDLELEAPSLAALVRSSAELAEGALLDLPADAQEDASSFLWERLGGPELAAIVGRHLAASGLHRQLLDLTETDGWPPAWHVAQATMTGGAEEPRGRTHTVAEFLALLGAGSPRARLQGGLVQLSGGGTNGREHLMRFTDATGSVDLAVDLNALPPGWVPEVAIEVEAVGRGPLPTWNRHQLDAQRLADIEARYGAVEVYAMSPEGRADSELRAIQQANLDATRAYKERVPLVERSAALPS